MDNSAGRLEALAQAATAAGEVIVREREAGRRAVALAQALGRAWPDAGFAACLLPGGRSVVGADGQERSAWNGPLFRELAKTAPEMPVEIGLPGQTVVARPLTWRGREFGQLAVAVPAAAAGVAGPELGLVAQVVAAHVAADTLRADLAAESPKADIGELAGSLIHDFTNLLNNLLLNLMVLEEAGSDLSAISLPKLRARAEQVTGLIREVQEYRRRKPPPGPPADLNAAVREAVELLNREHAEAIGGELPVDLDLAFDLAPVPGARTDLVRCLLFLLKSAARAGRRARRPLRAGTEGGAGAARVHVEVRDLQVPAESPTRLYDVLGTTCPGVSALELAAAKSVARHFNGKLSATCPPDVGLKLVLEVPTG